DALGSPEACKLKRTEIDIGPVAPAVPERKRKGTRLILIAERELSAPASIAEAAAVGSADDAARAQFDDRAAPGELHVVRDLCADLERDTGGDTVAAGRASRDAAIIETGDAISVSESTESDGKVGEPGPQQIARYV